MAAVPDKPDNSTSRTPARSIRIYRIIGFVLPWNTSFKTSRERDV